MRRVLSAPSGARLRRGALSPDDEVGRGYGSRRDYAYGLGGHPDPGSVTAALQRDRWARGEAGGETRHSSWHLGHHGSHNPNRSRKYCTAYCVRVCTVGLAAFLCVLLFPFISLRRRIPADSLAAQCAGAFDSFKQQSGSGKALVGAVKLRDLNDGRGVVLLHHHHHHHYRHHYGAGGRGGWYSPPKTSGLPYTHSPHYSSSGEALEQPIILIPDTQAILPLRLHKNRTETAPWGGRAFEYLTHQVHSELLKAPAGLFASCAQCGTVKRPLESVRTSDDTGSSTCGSSARSQQLSRSQLFQFQFLILYYFLPDTALLRSIISLTAAGAPSSAAAGDQHTLYRGFPVICALHSPSSPPSSW
eukprot:GHVU01112365.1.p1 GENE.GHVU01112365.1~~GHVU01112365.1.p1  ORF type:complete len:360 (-),score=19.74 GHVU01112365.1:1106-2185(-)